MVKGKSQERKEAVLHKKSEADRNGNKDGGGGEERKDRGKTKGFTGCGKLESSALLKLPSHCFWSN